MRYHHCLIKHDPPNSYGDCLRACVASIMNFERAEDVPHFLHDDAQGSDVVAFERFKTFVQSQNHRIIVNQYDGSVAFSDIVAIQSENATDVPCILIGDTEYGTHAIIIRNGKIAHNPAWYPEPMVKGANGVWTLIYVVPVNND